MPLHTSHRSLKLEATFWPWHTSSQKPWLPLSLGHFHGLWALLQSPWIVRISALSRTGRFSSLPASMRSQGLGVGWGEGSGARPWVGAGLLVPPTLTWAGPSLGWLRSAPSVITCRPILPAAPVPVKGLGGWAPNLAIWSSSSLRGLEPVALLPKLEAKKNGCHRANSPFKGV